ncbi:MAG: hypothetical protein IAI49_01910 [Candidatus Eremiobacteraeota bacterium]|nr:hypothetical protein [Candidatus Eremiobacteraeota bacterium]
MQTKAAVLCFASPALLAAAPASHSPSTAAPATFATHGERAPHTREHTEIVVEVNAKGQVVRADAIKASKDPAFDAITYGNALQAFIRRPDGTAVAGLYRLRYDYRPSDKRVRRDVELVRAGGVDPNAPGAVDRELQKVAAERTLPDLGSITGHRH